MKRKFSILFSLTIVIVFTSCKDYLNLDNPNSATPESFWKSDADAIKGVNGVYNILYYDGLYSRWTIFLECGRGDEIKSTGPWSEILDLCTFNMASAKNGWSEWRPWAHYYQGIYRANQVIDNLNGNGDISETIKNQSLGQAYFLRGLFYFNLLKFYGNIPLITKMATGPNDYFNPQVNSEDIWNQIYTDWSKASELLPIEWDSPNKGRATKGAAMAFLAKSYLWNKKYSEAAQLFETLTKSPFTYKLMSDYGDNFNETAPQNNAESIFDVQFSSATGGSNFQTNGYDGEPSAQWMLSSYRAQSFAASGYGWGDFDVNKWLLIEFQKEKTIDGKDDPRLNYTLWYLHDGETMYGTPASEVFAGRNKTKIYSKKYQHWRTKKGKNAEMDFTTNMNYSLMRYSDVLLMYAECLNELGKTNLAYDLIQQVRTRASLPDIRITKPSMSQDEMRDQITHERALELALEGQRFDDVRRWGWLGNSLKLKELTSNDAEFSTYVVGRELCPIPQRELDVSKYTNNAGY